MRWLVNYIRSCFCKHDWEMLTHKNLINEMDIYVGERWVYRCKKCGCFKKYESN